ncbi:hypothetical protein OV207_18690 [Corallococcus sp. BB11-1]|uniref:hypothetical protein n=1 Tax=Corallococcus sp. BB11-1 TaxID=2996783 RepID=UPI0010DF1CE3|nr:hypothetical protein [Corallococcus sp. BB11-1]MCY1033486.1 hypothetical protein [Corallococcus sp. BB11-1]RYZ44520.1 MAG: hypothetical protein EOO72_05975 [Myxococcaceae bacterium]
MAGAPAKAVQELTGHHNLSTTQRYMHLSPVARSAAIRMLEAPKPEPQNENGLEILRSPARFTDGRGDRI